jgi:uncharacterized membrane protein YbaN (DUF454 family)
VAQAHREGHVRALKKTVYKPLGFVFLFLGLLGIPLPVLPSTPFILLSAWFFARSSEKWHQWLLQSELFGPMLHNWEEQRCMSRRSKTVALVAMMVAGGASVMFAMDDIRFRVATLTLILVGGATVMSIKTCREEKT